jgi:DNA/RNA-binding domain of Phe-tRNA-synthetase-like protein
VKRHRPTHEAFIRRLLKEGSWPNINPIVDVYLANQVTHVLPQGGYDSDRFCGDLRLAVASEGGRFLPFGGGQEFTDEGEVVYRDSNKILTRKWNYRDCDEARIMEETHRFLLMIEVPGAANPATSIQAATHDLARSYAACFEGSFSARVLPISSDSCVFEL